MMTDPQFMGVEGGPASPLNYKRAVLKSAPREFTVEILAPCKHGSNFSYGLKVYPVIRSQHSSDSRSTSSHSTSSRSTSFHSEYEVWRRWEDCLDFQETLEAEYEKLSRQKVKVLRRGATGKKKREDGPYTFHDAAASFDSLPEGPDPREVAINVHELIPSLNRKGTLFRVSRSTVKQRGDEFAAMIEALFNASEDAPVLLQELRNCSSVRDFFGFWRRDKDRLKKSGKDVSHLFHSNHSLSSLSTSFSMSTSPSSPASSAFPVTPMSPAVPLRHSMFMRHSLRGVEANNREFADTKHSTPASAPPATRRFISDSPPSSRSFAKAQRDALAAASAASGDSMLFTDELLLQDDSGPGAESAPRRHPAAYAPSSAPLRDTRQGRPVEPLASRPANPGVPHVLPEDELPQPQRRPRSHSTAASGNRNARVFVSDSDSLIHPLTPSELSYHERFRKNFPHDNPTGSPPSSNADQHAASLLSSISSQTSSRPSSMSMTRFSISSSVSSYSQSTSKRSSCDSESCIDFELPFTRSSIVLHTPLSEVAELRDLGHRPRDSISSFASCRTEASADGVLPLRLRLSPMHRVQKLDPRANYTPMMERRVPSLAEESMSESGDDLIDSYLEDRADSAELSLESDFPRFISHGGKHSISSTSSTGSPTTGDSPRDDAFAIKAVYSESVVVFRAERSMPLTTIRQRIKDRFALHECVPLRQDFILAYLPSRAPVTKTGMTPRGRSNSVASSTADVSQLQLLQSEADWQNAMTTCGDKVTLRVLDAMAPV